MEIKIPRVRTIKFGNEELDLDTLLKTDYQDIRQASEELPAAIGWLEWQRACLVERAQTAELAWEAAEAQAYFDVKSGKYAEFFQGKLTDKAIDHAIKLVPEVEQACKRHAETKKWLSSCTGAIKALEAKMELVRTSEATRRRFQESSPSDFEKPGLRLDD